MMMEIKEIKRAANGKENWFDFVTSEGNFTRKAYNAKGTKYLLYSIFAGYKVTFSKLSLICNEVEHFCESKVKRTTTEGLSKNKEKAEVAEVAEVAEQIKTEQRKVNNGPVHHEKYEEIKTCLECGIPVYLEGPAGSGKNHTVEQIAKELGWNFYFTNSIQQEYKLTGFIDAGGKYHETEFYKACTDEEECIFFLDEMDASIPEVLVLLNMAIANGYFEFPNGRVYLKNIHFVSAGNTIGSGSDELYTGRMVLDQATLDRFAIIDFDYDKNIEYSITKGNEELIDFIHSLRKQSNEKGIRATFSYRCMTMVTKLEKAGMNVDRILMIAVFKGLDKDTINTFSTNMMKSSKYSKSLDNIKRAV